MSPDEQALTDVVKKLEDSWNASDSESYAAVFTEDTAFIHIFGGQLDGRSAVASSHRHIFDTFYKGSKATITINSVRMIRPDVAIVLAQARIQFREGDEAREIHTRPTLVLEKKNRHWQIVFFQNTRISDMPGQTPSNPR